MKKLWNIDRNEEMIWRKRKRHSRKRKIDDVIEGIVKYWWYCLTCARPEGQWPLEQWQWEYMNDGENQYSESDVNHYEGKWPWRIWPVNILVDMMSNDDEEGNGWEEIVLIFWPMEEILWLLKEMILMKK